MDPRLGLALGGEFAFVDSEGVCADKESARDAKSACTVHDSARGATVTEGVASHHGIDVQEIGESRQGRLHLKAPRPQRSEPPITCSAALRPSM